MFKGTRVRISKKVWRIVATRLSEEKKVKKEHEHEHKRKMREVKEEAKRKTMTRDIASRTAHL